MPLESTPRSFAALIVMSPMRVPTVASGATSPGRAFGAPQTICRRSLPVSTWQTCRRSASGCLAHSTMRATMTPSSASPSTAMSSTSRPIAVSVAASSSRVASVLTCWRSQFSENFIGAASCELAQEAHVVVEEAAQVVDAIAQHREALDAEAEGEAGVAFRIDADVAQHARMDHAAAEHFQPARAAIGLLPGDVDFRRRLGEREIARAETHFEIAFEECAHEFAQCALEVGEAGMLVDQQAFDLVEHRRVGLVAVAAIHLAGRDHAQRRLLAGGDQILHVADLHAGGVGAQQAAVRKVERVVHRARRMV